MHLFLQPSVPLLLPLLSLIISLHRIQYQPSLLFFETKIDIQPHFILLPASMSSYATRWFEYFSFNLPSLCTSWQVMLTLGCPGNVETSGRAPWVRCCRTACLHATARSQRFVMACRHPRRTSRPLVCLNKAPPDAQLVLLKKKGEWKAISAQLLLEENLTEGERSKRKDRLARNRRGIQAGSWRK